MEALTNDEKEVLRALMRRRIATAAIQVAKEPAQAAEIDTTVTLLTAAGKKLGLW